MRILSTPITAARGPIARLALRRYRLLSLASESPCSSEPRIAPVCGLARRVAGHAARTAPRSRGRLLVESARSESATVASRGRDTLPAIRYPWAPSNITATITIEAIPHDEWVAEHGACAAQKEAA